MKSSALSLLVLLLSSSATTVITALPAPEPQQQPAIIAPMDIATPVKQDTDQINRILHEGTLFLSFPDNGPEE
ncbi:hypothetical protein BD408DRAFT_424223 [Parasitella parasitica]|nr:hypothetical protein BD408DRAFT_424223 [Parasitella parasitica]